MQMITEILPKELVLSEIKAESKNEALMEFAEAIARVYPFLDKGDVAQVLLEREKLGSTGVQEGIAIPHGKLKDLDRMLISFGRSTKGIDFQSHDSKLTHLFFVLLAPENEAGMHLKVLARLSRLLKSGSLRDKLLKAKDANEIYETLVTEEKKI